MTGRKMGHLGTLWALRTDGREFPVEASISQVKTGERTLYTVILRDITKHRQAEEKLRQSEQRYRALTEYAPDGIVIFGSSGRIEYASPATNRIMGYSAAEIANTDPAQITHPDDLPGLLLVLTDLLQTPGKTSTVHYRMRHKDGSWVWLESNVSNFSDTPGIEGLVFNYRDITGRKQAEEALHQSEVRYQAIVEDQTEAIVRTKADGTILFANEAYSRLFGGTPELLIGQNFLSLLRDTERKMVQEKFSRLTPANPVEVDEHQTWLPNGRLAWLRWTDRGIFDDNGHLLEVQAVGYDITERHGAEEKLLQSETQLQHIVNTVPEGVLLLDAAGFVRLTNPVADIFLKILAPDLEHGRLTHLGHWSLNQLLTSPPKGLWHEITLEHYAFEAIARPVEHGPQNTGWVLVLRDITQERQIQQRAQQQDRLAAVGQLAAGIAHDFNNIMAVITLYAQLLLRKVAMPPDAQEKLNTIERQAHRATELIQQILDFSRQSVLDRQPLDLLPFMKELVKLLERTLPEDIQLELLYTGEEYIIHADPSRIQQVMMNLAVNARDAMPKGGRLRISLASVQTEKSKLLPVGDMPPGKWIQIEVSDSGIGIPPQVLSQIFEPFFTTKEVGKGTGLGLAQVYGIVQQHQGHIDVMTKVRQGTTFSLYFPALDAGEKAAVAPDTTSLPQGQGQTILVVEDNLAMRQALVTTLGFMNYEVIEATNGREALAILEKKAHHIDLVLSDIVMPEIGGIALLRAMHQQKLKIPVVLLTGHPLGQEMENLQAVGLAGWLPKPATLVNLSNLLVHLLAPQP
jgi:PAS domain S-box-containing protein